MNFSATTGMEPEETDRVAARLEFTLQVVPSAAPGCFGVGAQMRPCRRVQREFPNGRADRQANVTGPVLNKSWIALHMARASNDRPTSCCAETVPDH